MEGARESCDTITSIRKKKKKKKQDSLVKLGVKKEKDEETHTHIWHHAPVVVPLFLFLFSTAFTLHMKYYTVQNAHMSTEATLEGGNKISDFTYM